MSYFETIYKCQHLLKPFVSGRPAVEWEGWWRPVSEGSGKANVPWTIGLFLFCATVAGLNLGAPALFDPDEGRNTEIAREILLLNDWVTPHYNFASRLDKPILFCSLMAGSFQAFGFSEWAARFPSAVSALATLAVVYLFSARVLGVRRYRSGPETGQRSPASPKRRECPHSH